MWHRLRTLAAECAGSKWTETVLFRFTSGTSGFYPTGALLSDDNGGFYGVAVNGGVNSGGTVYHLAPSGNQWVWTLLHAFPYYGTAGNAPGALAKDSAGNLYGVTSSLGLFAGGTLFQLAPPAKMGDRWTLSILKNFVKVGKAIAGGQAPLVIDDDGTVYGETHLQSNPASSGGDVFKLTPPSSASGSWKETILYHFPSASGFGGPAQGLLLNRNTHVLYGTSSGGPGAVFQLSRPSQGGGFWNYSLLHGFNYTDGWAPIGPLYQDPIGQPVRRDDLGRKFAVGYRL